MNSIARGIFLFLSFAATVQGDLFNKPATLGAVNSVEVEITSGAELLYEWQDKLLEDNYFVTYSTY